MIKAILRGALAVITGYLIIMVAIVALFYYLNPNPNVQPSLGFMAFTLAYGLLFAFEGGYIAAWIGKPSPMKHAWALVGFTFVLWVISVIAAWGVEPLWYQVANLAVLTLGVVAGGALRAHRAQRKAAPARRAPVVENRVIE